MRHYILLTAAAGFVAMTANARDYVSTSAYTWRNDTIFQNEFFATAPTPHSIISTYSAQPGYFMPIEKSWHLKNDISKYPQLTTDNRLHTAIYNMGLDEMVNAVEPDTTLRTGKEWPGVWTRDVSYSIILSMAYLQPEATRISLMRKVDSKGRIIQDTGSGGAWPISTDRQIWTIAAWEYYKVTGDRKWLEYIYPIIKHSLEDDALTDIAADGLIKGETSFIDWREQSYPRWMQCADIYQSEALGTSVVHAEAWHVLAQIADLLKHGDVARHADTMSRNIRDAINRELWSDDLGLYAMYKYGRDNLIVNPRAETLGESLAILFDIADKNRARTITEHNPTTPYGPAIFYPQISDMPPYHNNALWPWVAAYWTMANAKAGNEQGVVQGIGSIFRPAALFATNKENFNLDNGDIATELNSSNMLWCLSGNIAMTHKVLFGIDYQVDGLAFKPFVPKVFDGTRSLTGLTYRGAILNITVNGYGDKIKSFTVNGKEHKPLITPKEAKGTLDIVIDMDNQPITPLKVNNVANKKAPLTPITWVENGMLNWNPIEYIGHYIVLRDGKPVATTHSTTFDASQPGEYQVIGVAEDGTQSFASEPRSTRQQQTVQMPNEGRAMISTEISYKGEAKGYTADGFVETDHHYDTLQVPVNVAKDGTYSLALRYANGNGPVNTENKCAIRTISVDGNRIGIVVMPTRGRGNWSDWGWTNTVELPLTAGQHLITISLLPENENMNIDTNHAIIDEIKLTLKN